MNTAGEHDTMSLKSIVLILTCSQYLLIGQVASSLYSGGVWCQNTGFMTEDYHDSLQSLQCTVLRQGGTLY